MSGRRGRIRSLPGPQLRHDRGHQTSGLPRNATCTILPLRWQTTPYVGVLWLLLLAPPRIHTFLKTLYINPLMLITFNLPYILLPHKQSPIFEIKYGMKPWFRFWYAYLGPLSSKIV